MAKLPAASEAPSGRWFVGRELVETETPLAENTDPENPDDPGPAVSALATKFTHDSMGRRIAAEFENQAAREKAATEYDGFGRVWKMHRVPGADGGDTYTTTYEYDNANNVTRTIVTGGGETWSDATAMYDEGGFNYESRQRLGAGTDGANDPVTQRKFDWAGNVTEERSLAGATPDDTKDRIITTHYDGANRADYLTDSSGGRTDFVRDDRGNVLEQTVKLNATDNAVTTTEYDALGRAFHVTSPADSAGGRPDAMRAFDSRGNLTRETLRDAADSARMSTFFFYDAAGRQERRIVLATAMDGSARNGDASNRAAVNRAATVRERSRLDSDGRDELGKNAPRAGGSSSALGRAGDGDGNRSLTRAALIGSGRDELGEDAQRGGGPGRPATLRAMPANRRLRGRPAVVPARRRKQRRQRYRRGCRPIRWRAPGRDRHAPAGVRERPRRPGGGRS